MLPGTGNRIGMELLWFTVIAIGAGISALARAETVTTFQPKSYQHQFMLVDGKLQPVPKNKLVAKKDAPVPVPDKDEESRASALEVFTIQSGAPKVHNKTTRMDMRDPMLGVPRDPNDPGKHY